MADIINLSEYRLKKAKNDFGYFCEQFLPSELSSLSPLQQQIAKTILDNQNRKVFVSHGRRCGKSWLMRALARIENLKGENNV